MEELQRAADNAIATSVSLCPSRLYQSARCTPISPSPRLTVPCQSVTSLTVYIAKYLRACVRVHE